MATACLRLAMAASSRPVKQVGPVVVERGLVVAVALPDAEGDGLFQKGQSLVRPAVGFAELGEVVEGGHLRGL